MSRLVAQLSSMRQVPVSSKVSVESPDSMLPNGNEGPVQSEKPFICQSCNKAFSTKDALKSHAKAKHGKHTCNVCSKMFKSKQALKQHENAPLLQIELAK